MTGPGRPAGTGPGRAAARPDPAVLTLRFSEG